MLPFFRFFALLFLIGIAAAITWRLGGTSGWHIWFGACSGALLWLIWDSWQAAQLLGWLRQLQSTDSANPPACSGLWREICDRLRRLLRQRDKLQQDNANRLKNFQSLLEASPNGIIVLDSGNRIEWCNQIACIHFGLDAKRDLAQSVTHLLRDPAFTVYLAAKDFAQPVLLNSPTSTSAHPLHLSVQLNPYGHNRTLMLSQDVTALKQAEAMRRDFVANVSHEIRTPLTVLAGFVETMQTLPLTGDERAHHLELMAQQAKRMQNLIGDLLTLSRLEDSPPPDSNQWLSIEHLLTRCETDARVLSNLLIGTQGKPHRLSFPDAAEYQQLGEIAGNEEELQSALFNLMNNAVRYTPPGGEIEVRWTPHPDGSASFSVRDNGPGIAPEHLPRLTERFYRADRGRSRETGGTGLGLSIVKHALQRHGATLHIDSKQGQGACFTVTFPAERLRRRKSRDLES